MAPKSSPLHSGAVKAWMNRLTRWLEGVLCKSAAIIHKVRSQNEPYPNGFIEPSVPNCPLYYRLDMVEPLRSTVDREYISSRSMTIERHAARKHGMR
jgi:hypothetical protein